SAPTTRKGYVSRRACRARKNTPASVTHSHPALPTRYATKMATTKAPMARMTRTLVDKGDSLRAPGTGPGCFVQCTVGGSAGPGPVVPGGRAPLRWAVAAGGIVRPTPHGRTRTRVPPAGTGPAMDIRMTNASTRTVDHSRRSIERLGIVLELGEAAS